MPYKPYSAQHKKAAKKDLVDYFRKKKPKVSPIMKAMQARVKRSRPHMRTGAPQRRKRVSPSAAAKFRAGFNR